MIDQKKVTEAIREFVKNPAWNDVFVNAPPGAMERLAISFYFSKFKDTFQPEDFDEYRNLREELERSLTEEDLEYLVTAMDKEDTIKHYEELLEKLRASGGQPEGQLDVADAEKEEDGQAAEGEDASTSDGEEAEDAVEEETQESTEEA